MKNSLSMLFNKNDKIGNKISNISWYNNFIKNYSIILKGVIIWM
jgi:hypothetical protein